MPSSKNNPLPVLFHVHGGGWRTGDKKLMKATAMFYASKGILFIAPNYQWLLWRQIISIYRNIILCQMIFQGLFW